jgi:hypothetical protein
MSPSTGSLTWTEAWKSLRFFQLFVVTVLVLLSVPLQLRFRAFGVVLTALYLYAVVVSLTTERSWARRRWIFLAAWVLAVVLRVVPVADPDWAVLFYVTSRVLMALVLGGCVIAALEYVLRGVAVSGDRIFAAIVAYMLTGLGFAAAYQATAALAPESFVLPPTADGPGALDRLEVQLIYFSFVTIATLGYGDIAPRLPLAQMLAVLEAVTGQFFVAVVIAWLVSVHASHRRAGG